MSKIYNMIETYVYRNAPDQDDHIVFETQLRLRVKFTMTRDEIYQTSRHSHSSMIGRETENALLDHMEHNSCKQIIDQVYGDYARELQEINAMLWKNDERYDISEKINKMIESMMGSE